MSSLEELERSVSLKKLVAAFVVVFGMFVAAPKAASAATIGFDCINCGGPNYAGYFSGNVVVAAGKMTLTLSNTGGGVISEVYVDAPGNGAGYSLFSIIENPPGVDFSPNGNPNHLPSDNLATPAFASELWATANNPSPSKGVGIGESLGLVFLIPGGLTQGDIDALLNDGSLRFGLHVQALPPTGGSQAFVNGDPLTSVPEPTSMLLLGTGLLAAARARRKKKV